MINTQITEMSQDLNNIIKVGTTLGSIYVTYHTAKFVRRFMTSQYTLSLVKSDDVPGVKMHYPLPRVKESVSLGLTQMLHDIDEAYNHADIPWSCACGTALGAYRHKGLIPWDNDLDIIMRFEDQDVFRSKISPYLEHRGYETQWYPGRFFIRSISDPELVCDAFFVSLPQNENDYVNDDDGTRLMVYSDDYTRNKYGKQTYNQKTFTTPELREFGGRVVPCPYNLKSFITRSYSAAALTEGPKGWREFKEYWMDRMWYHHPEFRDTKIARGKKMEHDLKT